MCLKPPKTLGQVLAPWGLAWCLCARRQGCGCAAGSRLTQGPLKSPKGISVFLDGKQVLPAHLGRGPAVLYTTVLRELRLWRPPPGSASVARALPLWAGSGGTRRTLLLSAESSSSAREALGVGRGCSRRRGAAPSPPPSPVVSWAASAGSKASSSAGGDGGQQGVVLAQGMLFLLACSHQHCRAGESLPHGAPPCSPRTFSMQVGCVGLEQGYSREQSMMCA